MNRQEFLDLLKEELYDREVSAKAIDEIIEDHDAMISEAVDNGMIENEFIDMLGKPSTIARTIARTEVKESGVKGKLIATTPFISLVIFFILGMQFDLWHPGWLVFMLVPISGVVLGGRLNLKTQLVGLSPFVTFIFFMLYGHFTDVWHPTWIVFFIIPVLGLMFEKDPLKKYGGVALFTIIPLLYYYLETSYDYQYSWLLFSVLVAVGFWTGTIQITIAGNKQQEKEMKVLITVLSVIYLALGVLFNWWHPGWLVFLVVPVYAMFKVEEKIPFVAYTPFISTLLFVVIGEAFDIYHWAWLVFLLIPIMGIFTESGETKKIISIEGSLEDYIEDKVEDYINEKDISE